MFKWFTDLLCQRCIVFGTGPYCEGCMDRPLSTELLTGVVKPTYALAGMIAAHVLKNFENVRCDRELVPSNLRVYMYERDRQASFTDDKMSVNVSLTYRDVASDGYKYVLDRTDCSVAVKYKRISFDTTEASLIVEAMKKACKLKQEKVEADNLSAHQQQACDIIQELFGPAVEEEAQNDS